MCRLCFVLINSAVLNLSRVWRLSETVRKYGFIYESLHYYSIPTCLLLFYTLLYCFICTPASTSVFFYPSSCLSVTPSLVDFLSLRDFLSLIRYNSLPPVPTTISTSLSLSHTSLSLLHPTLSPTPHSLSPTPYTPLSLSYTPLSLSYTPHSLLHPTLSLSSITLSLLHLTLSLSLLFSYTQLSSPLPPLLSNPILSLSLIHI